MKTATITRQTSHQFVAKLDSGRIVGFNDDADALAVALLSEFDVRTTTGVILGTRAGEIVRLS